MRGPACLMYTFPHFHGLLLAPSVFRIMLSFMEKIKAETFLSRMPTLTVLCLNSTMLLQLKSVQNEC
jgi:hypothetical protein